eukprot:TRINITY_DN10724_c1_g3_i2.p5 TRINITY_DN10724_c1_g3~~TRINITY_DN10724_c1_g3_i2.p5  ORF type:complete len:105 (-),score=2.77 TRINITY_DN10724_c1_g3_i2:74-388(-)
MMCVCFFPNYDVMFQYNHYYSLKLERIWTDIGRYMCIFVLIELIINNFIYLKIQFDYRCNTSSFQFGQRYSFGKERLENGNLQMIIENFTKEKNTVKCNYCYFA